MIKSLEVATEVDHVLQEVFDKLGNTLIHVKKTCTASEAALYQEPVGDILYIIIFKLLEPLYEQHPSLKPADWDNRKT